VLFAVAGGVAAAVAYFVSFEVRNVIDAMIRLRFLAALWSGAAVAVVRVITIVYVALKILGAVKPRACADEGSAGKPFRTVIAVRSAAVRSGVIITVGTFGSDSDFEPDFLRRRFRSGNGEAESSDSNQYKTFEYIHEFSS
jgi:hypothetical protein